MEAGAQSPVYLEQPESTENTGNAGQPACRRATGAEQAPVNYGQSPASNVQHHLHTVKKLLLTGCCHSPAPQTG